MIKGDLRKKQILETAERLFTEHGYERTGVQDILDVLNLSKGSFYHHFASKELVLLTICESRAELSAAHYRAEETENGLERMNRLLSGMIPFQGEGLAFLKMLMPVFLLPEGKSVLNGYQEALKSAWLPMTIKALEQMINQKAAFARFPEKLAGILLDMINDRNIHPHGYTWYFQGESGEELEIDLDSVRIALLDPVMVDVDGSVSALPDFPLDEFFRAATSPERD